ncbi:MAG: MoxR family ATPase [Bacteroidota bacterium]
MENNMTFDSRLDMSELLSITENVRNGIRKAVVGQDSLIDMLIVAILADGHILLEGVPGIAKTLTAKAAAKCLDASFTRIQFTPDLMPSDLIGSMVFDQRNASFEYRRGPVFTNILLIDEINRSPAKTQSALFEAMEERQVSMEGQTHLLPVPFLVIATQNPVEYEGTYRLPEAQLDRFMFKLVMDYPEEDAEIRMLEESMKRNHLPADHDIKAVTNIENILKARKLITSVIVDEKILKYITGIMRKTRRNPAIYLGASPRASLMLMFAAKAFAAINGRDFVTPEDVKEVSLPVLRHRLMLTPEKEMEGVTADDILKQIVNSEEIPR